MKKIYINRILKLTYLLSVTIIISLCCSCEYNELPPKTDDASTGYLLPKGSTPSENEKDIQKKLKDEYNEAIKQ